MLQIKDNKKRYIYLRSLAARLFFMGGGRRPNPSIRLQRAIYYYLKRMRWVWERSPHAAGLQLMLFVKEKARRRRMGVWGRSPQKRKKARRRRA